MKKRHVMECIYNVETPVGDGTILRGDLYTPDHSKKYPALLIRTVFRKRHMSRSFDQYDPSFFVENGYCVFIQDVRGLGESEGEFDRFTADGKDGYDTVEWIARQDWCDGNVGMMGNYYAGYLQIMAARENPPHLKAICPMQTSVSINRDCDNRGFLFASHVGWCTSRVINRLTDGRYDKATEEKYLPMLQECVHTYTTSQLKALPLADMPIVNETPFKIYQDYFNQLVDGYDDFSLMEKEGRNMDVSKISTPAFYISGWYDSARNPSICHCMSQRKAGTDSKVLIAPIKPGSRAANPDSALEDGIINVDIQQEMLRWFDSKIKGREDDTAPVRYFAPNGEEEYTGGTWEDDGAGRRELFLDGAGTLDEKCSSSASELKYFHRWESPLPYRPYGHWQQLSSGDRQAVCMSRPLGKDMVICGLARCEIYISADTPDCDIMVTILDVDENGESFAICDGATRARYREDWVSRPLEAGKVYKVDVLCGRVVYKVRKNHRVAAAVYGSAFPKYDVNHCTGQRPAYDRETRESNVTVHCGGNFMSKIILPEKQEM